MAVYTGEFRDLEAVAALTVATVAEADDPAILERLVSALVAAGFEQEDAWAPLSLEKPLEPPPPGPPRYHLLVPRSLRSSPDSSSQANFLSLLPPKAVFERLAEVEPRSE